MASTAERITQAEEGIAQVQSVLDHAQSALEVAGTVESAARRSRRWLKILLVAAGLGIAVLIVVKVTGRGGTDAGPGGGADPSANGSASGADDGADTAADGSPAA